MTWLSLAAAAGTALVSALLTHRAGWTTAKPWIAAFIAAVVSAWATVLANPWALPGLLMLAVTWGASGAVDLGEHRLPDSLTLVPFLAFFILQLPSGLYSNSWGQHAAALIGAILTAGILFLIAFIRPAAFGLGDVKLGLTTGAVLGWLDLGSVLIGVAAAFVLLALFSVPLLSLKMVTRNSDIPFGPFMLLGVLVAPATANALFGAG